MGSNTTNGANGVDANTTEPATAGHPRSARRRACDRFVAGILADILKARREAGDESTSDENLRDALDVKSKTTVGDLRNGETPIHLGDLFCLPYSLAKELHAAIGAEMERRGGTPLPPKDLRDHALDVSEEEGALSKAVRAAHADGTVDEREERAIKLQALKVATTALEIVASPKRSK